MVDEHAALNVTHRFSDNEQAIVNSEQEHLELGFTRRFMRPEQSQDVLGVQPGQNETQEEFSGSSLILPQDKSRQSGHRWLVELQGLGEAASTLPMVVVGEVVLGIDRNGKCAPDLDLSLFGGDEKGVSRQHAVLRPTWNRLYLMDLNSTNGTLVNSVSVPAGVEIPLLGNDTISLGALTFLLKVFETPETLDAKTLRAASKPTIPATTVRLRS